MQRKTAAPNKGPHRCLGKGWQINQNSSIQCTGITITTRYHISRKYPLKTRIKQCSCSVQCTGIDFPSLSLTTSLLLHVSTHHCLRWLAPQIPQILSFMGHSTQYRVTFIFTIIIQNLVCTISVQMSGNTSTIYKNLIRSNLSIHLHIHKIQSIDSILDQAPCPISNGAHFNSPWLHLTNNKFYPHCDTSTHPQYQYNSLYSGAGASTASRHSILPVALYTSQ